MNLSLDIIASASIVIFIIFILKLWILVKHKSLFLFMFAGIAALFLRVLLLSATLKITTLEEINLMRNILSNILWFLWALGAIFLYLEVKNLIRRK